MPMLLKWWYYWLWHRVGRTYVQRFERICYLLLQSKLIRFKLTMKYVDYKGRLRIPTQSTQFFFLHNRHNSSSYTTDTILSTKSTQFLFLHNRGNSSSKLNSHNFGEFSFLRNVKTRLLSCTLYQPNRPLRVKRHNSNYHSKIPNSNNGTLPARNVSCNISTQHSFSHADDLCQLMTRCKIFHENLIIMHPVIKLSAAKQRKKLYYRVLSNEPLYPRHIQTHPAHTLNTYHVRTHVNPLNPLAG